MFDDSSEPFALLVATRSEDAWFPVPSLGLRTLGLPEASAMPRAGRFLLSLVGILDSWLRLRLSLDSGHCIDGCHIKRPGVCLFAPARDGDDANEEHAKHHERQQDGHMNHGDHDDRTLVT